MTFTLSATGTASWILRFRIGGKPEELTLGRYPDLTLSAARKLAAEKRVEVQKGNNPATEKRKDKSRTNWTVRQLVADYREKVLANLATSTQRSDGRNLKRVENVLGAMHLSNLRKLNLPEMFVSPVSIGTRLVALRMIWNAPSLRCEVCKFRLAVPDPARYRGMTVIESPVLLHETHWLTVFPMHPVPAGADSDTGPLEPDRGLSEYLRVAYRVPRD